MNIHSCSNICRNISSILSYKEFCPDIIPRNLTVSIATTTTTTQLGILSICMRIAIAYHIRNIPDTCIERVAIKCRDGSIASNRVSRLFMHRFPKIENITEHFAITDNWCCSSTSFDVVARVLADRPNKRARVSPL